MPPLSRLRQTRLVLLALPLILSACRAEDLKPVVTAPNLPGSYRLEKGVPLKAYATTRAWWQAFRDPALDRLLSQTAQNNLTLAQARQRLIAARALAHAGTTGYAPNLGLNSLAQAGTGKSVKDDMIRRPLQLNLEVGWEVALFGEDKLKQQSAELSASMAGEDLEAARLAVMADTAFAYVKLRGLQTKSENARQRIKLLSQAQTAASRRARNGLDTTLQADAMNVRLQSATLERAKLEAATADAMQQIATLAGSAIPDPALAAQRPQPQAPIFLTSHHPADVLRRRPDVRRAEMAALQAGAELGLAKADLYPKLHLSGMIGIGTPVNGSLFGLMGGPSLQLPLLDQGKRRDMIAARQALLEEAMAAYRQSVLVAYEETSAALRALQVARQDVVRLKDALNAAKRARGAANLLLREGLSDAASSVADNLTVLDIDNQLAQAIEDEALAQIVLVKALAGDVSPGTAGAPQNGR